MNDPVNIAREELDRAVQALLQDDAHGIASRVVAGELRAQALLAASLQRIEALDGDLGAVCWLAPDLGRAVAQAVDAEVSAVAGRPDAQRALLRRRPFAGVPFLLKDLGTAAIGLPSRMGSRLFGEFTGGPVEWPVDSELVRRYREAGLVPFGRSTSPELGISASTEARAYGRPTRNPWNPLHSAGGSSGGAAAATAARLVAIAHATDGAGSIRIPASCCGLIGLKPSRALMPTGPLHGEAWGGFATEHVLTHSIRDCALALAVSAGGDVGAFYPAPAVSTSVLWALAGYDDRQGGRSGEPATEPAGVPATGVDPSRPLQIGFIDTRFEGTPIDPRIAAAVREVAKVLEQSLGHAVEPATIPVSTHEIVETVIRTMTCWSAAGVEAFCRDHGLDLATLPDDVLEPATWGAIRVGRQTNSSTYIDLMARASRLARAIAVAIDRYDVVITPTLAEPPARIGRFAMNNPDYLDYRLGNEGLIHYSPFTPLANLTGQPAVSLPLAMVDGLPVGIQLIGRMGADASLLALCCRLETLLPWRGRRAEPART